MSYQQPKLRRDCLLAAFREPRVIMANGLLALAEIEGRFGRCDNDVNWQADRDAVLTEAREKGLLG
jgi:hypothetical protein